MEASNLPKLLSSSDEFHDLYSSQNIIRVIKSRKMKWAGHVARVVEMRGAYRVLVGDLREREHMENLCLNGKVLLKCIFIMLNRACAGLI